MADQTSTPTTSPIGSTVVPGKYTSEKLFLQLDPTEFNSHESDINNNGQIAFVANGDSSFIYAKGVKVGGTDIKVEDLNLSNYATKDDVSTAIADLDVTDTAKSGQYVSAVSEENGKIKVTRANLPTVQTVSVSNSNNSVTINGTKYTLGISNGVLSFAPYKAASISSYSLSTISANKTQTGAGTFYVGTKYKASVGIDITSTSQKLTINIDNPTGNQCKLAVSDGSGSYFRQDSSYSALNGAIEVSIGSAYIMKDVKTQTWSNEPVTWAAAKTHSVDTTGEKTFGIYFTEKNKSTISKSITQSNINASVTIKAKVPVLYSTDNFTNKNLIKDIEYGNVPSTLAFGAGISKKVTYIAIPKVLGKNISKVATGIGNLAFTKQSTTKTITYNNSSLEYYIYVSDAQITLESNATIHLA